MGPRALCLALVAASLLAGMSHATDVKDGACVPQLLTSTSLPKVTFPGKIEQLFWFGKDDFAVFAITQDPKITYGGQLWRNDHSGDSAFWEDKTGTLRNLIPPEFSPPEQELAVVALYHHPGAGPENMYIFVQGAGSWHWYSKDAGRTFSTIHIPDAGIVNVKPHPTEPNMILILVRRAACFGDDRLTNPMCTMDLLYSDDYGAKLQNLTESSRGGIYGFVDYEWGHKTGTSKQAKETILASVYEMPPGAGASFVGWDSRVAFVRSTSLFRDKHEKLIDCGNQFEVVGNNVYLAITNDCPAGKKKSSNPWDARSSSVSLHVSSDNGESFDEICFPVALNDRGYSLMDFVDGSVLIGVDHDEEDMIQAMAPIGNIYSSGKHEALFSLSLKHDFQVGSLMDFNRVHSLPGTFIANQVDIAGFDDPSFGTKTTYTDYVSTKITFNRGSRWHDITPPLHDAAGTEYTCYGPCRLHLHGPVSWSSADGGATQPTIASVYSQDAAPGIVMGMGNVGRYLSFDPTRTNTYLSRDGGSSWDEVKKGPHIFEIGDHGGIIVLARLASNGPTDHLLFSLDDGKCWEGPVYFSEAISVHNIRVEPKAISHRFIIHGAQCVDDPNEPATRFPSGVKCGGEPGKEPQGVAYFFDAKAVLKTFDECTQVDYEEWTPCKDHCLLGRNLTYQRQKPDAICFNGELYKHRVVTSNCTCSDAWDTECDFGSERGSGGECKPILGLDQKRACPLVQQGKYVVSDTHERLIAHDTCTDLGRIINDTDGQGQDLGGHKKHGCVV
mmetsp:Transcript_6271/g.21539  ORF Transcript_6271/g.21539 Transcript_6271/m.21539 type:complete len:783 (+) Transcript_6271:74-2422(+)